MLEKILYKPCKYGAEIEYWVNFLCPPMIYGGDGKYGYGFDLLTGFYLAAPPKKNFL